MIKQRIISEELIVDSHLRRDNGLCPLMPEEVEPGASLKLCLKMLIWTPFFISCHPLCLPSWCLLKAESASETCGPMCLNSWSF